MHKVSLPINFDYYAQKTLEKKWLELEDNRKIDYYSPSAKKEIKEYIRTGQLIFHEDPERGFLVFRKYQLGSKTHLELIAMLRESTSPSKCQSLFH